MRFEAAQIGPATPGAQPGTLNRRIELPGLYRGRIRYDQALEAAVPDVPAYIADWLNDLAAGRSYAIVAAWLYSPVDVPMPSETPRIH